MDSKIKNENYIVIQGFMINDLHLKSNDLLVYAIIYGFTQTDEQWFTGGLQYLAEWTNCTKRSVINTLNNLLQRELIIKNEYIVNNVKFAKYRANIFIGSENFSQGYENFSLNNINNNINNKKKENILKEKNILEVFNLWNDKKIVVHRELTDDIAKTIAKCLTKFSFQQIAESINNYATIFNDDTYYFNYKWTLKQFLSQKNAVSEFMSDGSKWINYKSTAKPKTVVSGYKMI